MMYNLEKTVNADEVIEPNFMVAINRNSLNGELIYHRV